MTDEQQQEVMERFQLADREWLGLLLLPTAEERLARLLRHMEMRGVLRVTQSQMAEACDLARETVSRLLTAWLLQRRVRIERPGGRGRRCYVATELLATA